jgi:hypothetical protein
LATGPAATAADIAIRAGLGVFDLDGDRCKFRNCLVRAGCAFEARSGKGQLDVVWLALVQDFLHNRHSAASIYIGSKQQRNTVEPTATRSAEMVAVEPSRLYEELSSTVNQAGDVHRSCNCRLCHQMLHQLAVL